MEFWGVEVKAGECLKVQPEFGKLIHISQAALGEVKDVKGAKYVPLRLKIDDKKFIIGSLSSEDRPQLMFDLVFEREFEISHDWKNGSVYFVGYTADEPASDEEFDSDDFDSEDEPVDIKENGAIKPKSGVVKPVKAGKKEADSDEDDSESSSDDEIAPAGLQQFSSDVSGDDSDVDEDDSDSSDEEETPKAQQTKKRPAEPQQKTPASKKAKSATPDKSGKKGQTAAPAPSKSAGKDKAAKEQSPKSNGQLSCKSCSKTFTSGKGLESHTKAKHAAAAAAAK